MLVRLMVAVVLFAVCSACNARTTETPPNEPPPVERPSGPYLKELAASARVEMTAHWPREWASAAEKLAAFARDCGAEATGPLVALDMLLPDMVDSAEPSAELVYAVTGPDDLPEGGEDMALLKVRPCTVVAMSIEGNHHQILGALGELAEWAKKQGHDIELRPGVILADPATIESGGTLEIFYPLRQELPQGEFSFCSPGLGK